MDSEHYEYRGFLASAWDLLRGDTSDWSDRPFYRNIILQSGQPALDIGCGTGRLLLDYLAEGIDIDGVDNSPEMLAICREKAQKCGLHPTLFHQSMEALAVPRKYRTIIGPSSSFQLVTDPNAATKAMSSFFHHLEPGGILVMPFMILWQGPVTDQIVTGEWELIAEQVRPEDGVLIRRWTRSTYHLPQQLEDTEDRAKLLPRNSILAPLPPGGIPRNRPYTSMM